MSKQCKVTYIRHSGVLVETSEHYLLFDYWEGEIPSLDSGKDLYIFSSHVHRDHFTKEIFKLENSCVRVAYILSSDIKHAKREWVKAENVIFVDPDETRQVGDLQVTTFRSTDEGVAFLVKVDGLTIYHAGDLHWWYWPQDPEEDNMGRRKNNYLREIEKLSGESIDISFVVLDPRQDFAGGYGMDEFLSHVRSRYVFPIHFWENYPFIHSYIDQTERKYPVTCLVRIEGPGQVFELDL
jgi:L-ascorbate metabolism protein UlaG (beta-lactamase superfamily)